MAALLREHLVTHYKQLHGRLTRHLGCSDLAAECLHDTWLRLCRPLDGSVASVDAYVWRMACHAGTDRLRAQRSWLPLDELRDDTSLMDSRPGPHAVAEARSSLVVLSQAMDSLSRRQRAVLLALRVEERSRGEVAQWLRISVRSVDTALRQALAYCDAHCADDRGRD